MRHKVNAINYVLSSLLVICFLFTSVRGASAGFYEPVGQDQFTVTELDYESIINEVNMSAVKEHMEFFSSLETRGVGYPGNEMAANYIRDKFENYANLGNVSFEEFEVFTCFDNGANITFGSGQSIKVYALPPNLHNPSTTPPEGVTGHLIYAKDGELTDFDGLKVEGSIVILNWYARDRWLNAAYLGAKAVVFIPPDKIIPNPYFAADWGWNLPDVPILFPRFYAPNVTLLLDHVGETVTLKAHTAWKTVTSWNVLGFIEGENPDMIATISAHYDSGGIVAGFAPGARESNGISALIEIARYFSVHKPKCTIMFVALSGHWNGFAGATKYIYDYPSRLTPAYKSIGDKMQYAFHLDLSTGSSTLFFSTFTTAIAHRINISPFLTAGLDYFEVFLNDVNEKKPLGKTYDAIVYGPIPFGAVVTSPQLITKTAQANSFAGFLNDQDAVFIKVIEGWGTHVNDWWSGSFITAEDSRPRYGYPFDLFNTMDDADFSRLETQLELVYMYLSSFLFHENIYGEFVLGTGMLKQENPMIGTWEKDGAWEVIGHRMIGSIVTWNDSIGWYSPVSDAILHISGTRQLYFAYVYYSQYGLVEKGNYTIDFLGDVSAIDAYVINSTTGATIYAPNQGMRMYTGAVAPPQEITGRDWFRGFFTVFESGTVVLIHIEEPSQLTHNPLEPITLNLIKPVGYVTPESYGILYSGPSVQARKTDLMQSLTPLCSIAVVAFPPETPVVLTSKRVVDRYPWFVLSNSSADNLEGSGYAVKPQEQLILTHTVLRLAEDMYRLNEEAFTTLVHVNPLEKNTAEYEDYLRAGTLITAAHTAIDNYEYSKSFAYAQEAWSLSAKTYAYARSKIEDTIYVVPFFAFLLVPFAFLFEKLVFTYTGTKRIISFIGVFVVLTALISILHPGFGLASNPSMIVMGASLIILIFPLLAIMMARIFAFIKAVRIQILGRHEAEVSRGGETVTSFSIGIANMRKRKLRTSMLLIAVILMVTGLTSFSSLSSIRVPSRQPVPIGYPLYDGFHVHKRYWGQEQGPSLHQDMLTYVTSMFGSKGEVAPRAWKYCLFAATTRVRTIGYKVSFEDEYFLVRTLWGLTPQESNVSGLDAFMVAGRWFVPGDYNVVIVSDAQAQTLGADVGDAINIHGLNLRIAGIIDGGYSRELREIDGEGITPLKLDLAPNPWTVHVPSNDTLILPYDFVMDLGGDLASISVKIFNASAVSQEALALRKKLYLTDLWYSEGGQTFWFTVGTQLIFGGFQLQVVPLALVGISILNMLLGSVYERRREILIFSSVGLSPSQISFLFIAETLVYGILGAIVGYLGGVFLCLIGGSLPGISLYFNYGSSWVFYSLLISIAIVFGSSIYPALLSSRLVTPAAVRAWRFESKPVGDRWEIPLPFSVERDEEVHGIIAFLHEYLSAHLGEAALMDFTARNLGFEAGEVDKAPLLRLQMETRLPPYDLNVVQETSINFLKKEKTWNIRLLIKRLSGSVDDWTRLNREFVNSIRKQLLLWRSFTPEDRWKYTEQFGVIKGEEK